MSLRTCLLATALLFAVPSAQADRLLIDRARAGETAELPARGLTMTQVQARFGSPERKLEPRGGERPQWPEIHRWSYANFTVYFERDRVIDSVLNRASPQEIGPAPVQRGE